MYSTAASFLSRTISDGRRQGPPAIEKFSTIIYTRIKSVLLRHELNAGQSPLSSGGKRPSSLFENDAGNSASLGCYMLRLIEYGTMLLFASLVLLQCFLSASLVLHLKSGPAFFSRMKTVNPRFFKFEAYCI